MNEAKRKTIDAEEELVNVLLDLIISSANLAKKIRYAMKSRQINEKEQ